MDLPNRDTLKNEQHLTQPGQYAIVYDRGRSWANNLLVLKALPNGLLFSRYGFSVSKRIGGAVKRNRVKRRLREILRITPLQPGWDLVFIARSPIAVAQYAAVKQSVESLLSRASLLARNYEGISPGTN